MGSKREQREVLGAHLVSLLRIVVDWTESRVGGGVDGVVGTNTVTEGVALALGNRTAGVADSENDASSGAGCKETMVTGVNTGDGKFSLTNSGMQDWSSCLADTTGRHRATI